MTDLKEEIQYAIRGYEEAIENERARQEGLREEARRRQEKAAALLKKIARVAVLVGVVYALYVYLTSLSFYDIRGFLDKSISWVAIFAFCSVMVYASVRKQDVTDGFEILATLAFYISIPMIGIFGIISFIILAILIGNTGSWDSSVTSLWGIVGGTFTLLSWFVVCIYHYYDDTTHELKIRGGRSPIDWIALGAILVLICNLIGVGVVNWLI